MHDFKGNMVHGTSQFSQMLHLKFNTELNFLYSPTLFLRTKIDKIKLYVYMHMHFDREFQVLHLRPSVPLLKQ